MGTNTSSIDHIITNMTSIFMQSCTVQTGISDYHKLIMSISRMTFVKGKMKNSVIAVIRIWTVNLLTLIKNLSQTELPLKSFKNTFSLTLEKFAPLKQKYLRHNNSPFMNRTFKKVIMTMSKLKRRYNLDRTTISFENY